jgi:hypothetical protein
MEDQRSVPYSQKSPTGPHPGRKESTPQLYSLLVKLTLILHSHLSLFPNWRRPFRDSKYGFVSISHTCHSNVIWIVT